MASLLTVRLLKGDSPSWGFRLQGGIDFGTPLVIQKVIVGSPAERAGLVAGDSVIRVNNTDVFNLRHKDAQDVLLRAGNSFDMTIQRGGSTWKPYVIPTGSISTPSPAINNISPVTRTSLAARPTEDIGAIGTGHNISAKPFLNGTLNGGPKLVSSQYNSPLKLYSEESIAETLSAQTEVLSTGALGVNFKKNEKNYDASKSAVLSFLKEEENSPRTPDHTDLHQHNSSGIDSAPSPLIATGLRHVAAPENKPQPPSPQLPPGQNICADCERLIVGVFVRIKDKNLHVECFKCSTCGSSLKNVGYYNINNKLYCDIHAKLAARNNPPAPNLVPITVSPGGKAPVNAISAALATHPYPTSAPLSPKINSYQSSLSGPRPFGSVPGPLSPSSNLLTKTAAPLSPVAPISAPSYSPVPSTVQIVSNIVWPPVQEEPELPSACPLFYPPPSQVTIKPRNRPTSESSDHSELETFNAMEHQYQSMDEMSFASGRRSATQCAETITETVGRQMLVETIMRTRPQSPPRSEVRITPQVRPEAKKEEVVQEKCKAAMTSGGNLFETIQAEHQLTPPKIDDPTPKKWESQMLQALTISIDDSKSESVSATNISCLKTSEAESAADTSKLQNTFSNIPTKKTSTALGSALSVAPTEPFNPVKKYNAEPIPLPEETVPYFPPEDLFVVPIENVQDSQKPGKKKKDPNLEKMLDDLPKPQQKLSMLAALTTAPERPFTPASCLTIATEESDCSKTKIRLEESEEETMSKCMKTKTTKNVEERQVRPTTLPQILNVQQEADQTPSPECLPLFEGFTCSFQNKKDVSQFDIQISTSQQRGRKAKKEKTASKKEEVELTENVCSVKEVSASVNKEVKVTETKENKTVEKQKQNTVIVKPAQMISLRKPEELPQYQRSLQENAEADLIMMQKMERSRLKKEQEKQKAELQQIQTSQKTQSHVSQLQQTQTQQGTKMEQATVMCPVITVQQGNHHSPENTFKPVVDSRPQSCTLPKSTPRPITPSMINKPPPMLPYYQANLVAQKHGPAIVNFLNPKSPAVSRSPSPLPEAQRAARTLSVKASNIRPKSPAQGPPLNPLQEEKIPTREDFKRDEAKQSLTTFIPQYKEKMDEHMTGRDSRNEQRTTMISSDIVTRRENEPVVSIDIEKRYKEEHAISKNKQSSCKLQESKLRETADSQKEETRSRVSGNTESTTKVSEKSHLEKSEDFRNIENKSVERSADGSVQIQRKRVVTEEMEHTQKSTEIVIEKNTSTMNQQGFRNVRNPEEDNQHVIGMHLTSPNPIRSPFLKSTQEVTPPKLSTVCQKVGKHVDCPAKTEEVCCEKSLPSVPTFDATTLPKPKYVPDSPFSTVEEKKPDPKPIKHVNAPGSSKLDQKLNPTVPPSDLGVGGGRQCAAVGIAPKRGRGILNSAQLGGRIPLCGQCHGQIRGPFITALGKIWCPNHFICATPSCRRPLQDMGFVEEQGQLYCEYCFEQYLAPICAKCGSKIKGDCLKAIGKGFHPECFNCVHCGKLFANSPFFLEDGSPYCETDWNELFTTKCFACGFPVEAGDRWVEALNNNYHSQCFNCTMCKKNLEGQSFFAKGGRPYCRNHAR